MKVTKRTKEGDSFQDREHEQEILPAREFPKQPEQQQQIDYKISRQARNQKSRSLI